MHVKKSGLRHQRDGFGNDLNEKRLIREDALTFESHRIFAKKPVASPNSDVLCGNVSSKMGKFGRSDEGVENQNFESVEGLFVCELQIEKMRGKGGKGGRFVFEKI